LNAKKESKTSFLQKRSKKLLIPAVFCWGCAAWAHSVVSLNLCSDQLLVLLAPEQVRALDFLARDPELSFVAAQAAHLPVVRADAEAVLNLHPDLVIAGRYGAQTTVSLLRARGLHVVQLDEPQDFDGIEKLVAQVADLLGVPQRGTAMVAKMQARLAALSPSNGAPRPRGRAVFYEAGGWTAGPGSLADAALHAAGWQNAGTGGRMGLEKILAEKPDLLVSDTAPSKPSMAQNLAWHPALHGLARKTVPPALLICGGPFSVEAAEILSH
jgi:iron complex transport system substrate-binding protein